jgi:hypothetical protein
MDDHAPLRDPSFQRHLPKFDEPADLVQRRIDREPRRVPHEALPSSETDYTTEWQIAPWAEAPPSLGAKLSF